MRVPIRKTQLLAQLHAQPQAQLHAQPQAHVLFSHGTSACSARRVAALAAASLNACPRCVASRYTSRTAVLSTALYCCRVSSARSYRGRSHALTSAAASCFRFLPLLPLALPLS